MLNRCLLAAPSVGPQGRKRNPPDTMLLLKRKMIKFYYSALLISGLYIKENVK